MLGGKLLSSQFVYGKEVSLRAALKVIESKARAARRRTKSSPSFSRELKLNIILDQVGNFKAPTFGIRVRVSNL
jgi:hypothetical protein